MAATTVTIKYVGSLHELIREGKAIARTMQVTGSYVDEPVMVNGYKNDGATGDNKSYGRSVYATNVSGFDTFPGLKPMGSATAKFAYFEKAILAAEEAKKAGTNNEGVSFTVDGYEDELYWEQMCANMVDNGFFSKVGTKTFGKDVA